MKRVAFSGIRGRGKYFTVSDVDYPEVSKRKWYLAKSGYVIPAVHRFIMEPPSGMVVDHKDNDRLNNTRSNLRVCTPQQNAWNRKKFQKTGSEYLGVFMRPCGTWGAQAIVKGMNRSLGVFFSEKDAARAYDASIREERGEFAVLNEVDS